MSAPLGPRLARGEPLRVLFFNDLGFQYVAGVLHLRQVQSFLLAGHEVAGLCWRKGSEEDAIEVAPAGAPGRWMGMRELPGLQRDADPETAAAAVLREVEAFRPDLVVAGNLHGAGLPLELLGRLRAAVPAVVAFMHDCYLATGRCPYPGKCLLYEVGCDETCPTAHEYPVLEPGRIAPAWRLRRELFSGPDAIPLAANSRWTLAFAERSMPDLRAPAVVYPGLDTEVFRPLDRAISRRLLGIPEDAFVVLAGAVNLTDRRKGGALLREVVAALRREARFLLFGAASDAFDGFRGTGLLRDYRKMPLLFGAADLFVGTAREEAFGLTLSEAAACGVPSVAFRVGGIPEATRDGATARLIEPFDTAAMIRAIRALMADEPARRALGAAGRALAESELTLSAQRDRWTAFLRFAFDGGPGGAGAP